MSDWIKSKRCGESSHCLEVTASNAGDGVLIRDAAHSQIFATTAEWHAFLAGAKAGDFDQVAR